MKTRILIAVLSAMAFSITVSYAGDLDVVGTVNVSSNLTAQKVTLGGETRTNWPTGGGATSGAADLTTAVLHFSQAEPMCLFTLTNHTAWFFYQPRRRPGDHLATGARCDGGLDKHIAGRSALAGRATHERLEFAERFQSVQDRG
jgi:hypothetical protein